MPPSSAASVMEGGLLARTLAHWAEQGWDANDLTRFRMEEGDGLEGLAESDIEAIESLSESDIEALEALSEDDRAALAPSPTSDLERRLARTNRESASRRRELQPWRAIGKDYGLTAEQVREVLTKAAKGGTPKNDDGNDGPTPDEIRREARREATSAADRKVVKAEVKSAAVDLFADPADAAAFLDLDKYEVDDDGDLVDPDELLEDLKDLLERKPHLAKAKEGRKQPKPDAGQGRRDDRKTGLAAGAERARAKFGTKPDADK